MASTDASGATPEKIAVSPGMRLGDRYHVLELLGRGAMGAVWLARDEVLGEKFALKFVARDLRGLDLLRDEVRLAQRVTHRNVCRTFDLVEASGLAFVKMEFVAGESLTERIRRDGRCSVDEALRIARQICAALEAAHACGIVHRDLKPSNVMVDDQGRVVVMDFGIARSTDAGGEISGTPTYMAPEQASGFAVDGRADLYALGCVLFELIAGRPPFIGASADETLLMHAETPAPSLKRIRPDTPTWLCEAVSRLLAKDPSDRYADAAVLSAALHGPRRRWPLLAAVGLAAFTVTAVFASLRRGVPEWRPLVRDHLPIFDENTNGASISPDGKWLVFASDREGNQQVRLYVAPVEGGVGRPVTSPDQQFGDARWDADGQSLIAQNNNLPAVFRVPLNGGPKTLLAGRSLSAELCGGRLVYVQIAAPGCESCEAVVIRSASGDRELFRSRPDDLLSMLRCDHHGRWLSFVSTSRTRGTVGQTGDAWAMRLHADGTAESPRLLVGARKTFCATVTDEETLVFSMSQHGRVHLWEMPLSGGAPIQRTFGEGPDQWPEVSFDGKQLVYVVDATYAPLMARSLATSTTRRVTAAFELMLHVVATVDGRTVVAEALRDGKPFIVAVDLATGEERVIAEGHHPAVTEHNEVLFAGPDYEGGRLSAIPLAGGVARDLALIPGPIDGIAVGGETVHLKVNMAAGAQAWRVPLRGGSAERESQQACFVMPTARGESQVELDCSRGIGGVIRVADSTIEGVFGQWDADGSSFVYWRSDGAHRRYLDGRDELLMTIPAPRWLAVSPDRETIYYSDAVSHVRREIITNWDSRPRPWRR